MLRFLALVKDENEWNDPDREKPKYVEHPLIGGGCYLRREWSGT
jgi:hypothetical protein